MLGIVTGLKSEARILRGLDVRCISIGGKADGAAAKIERLIVGGVSGLVSFGIAGALSPHLRAGDVVVADAVQGGTSEVWRSNPAWVDSLRLAIIPPSLPGSTRQSKSPSAAGTQELESPGLAAEPVLGRRPGDDGSGDGKVGAILGLDRLLSSPQDKAAAFARSGAIAIDMESHHVARAAAAHGLPFVALRAISDRADEALPACFVDFVDRDGATKLSAVLAALISGRVGLGQLIAAGRSSRRAHQALFRCRGTLASLR